MGALSSAFKTSTLALLLCIAYDTSANVSPLEGGHRHLTFVTVIIIAAVAAFLGAATARGKSVTKSSEEVPPERPFG